MGASGNGQERERLAELYAAKADVELENLAAAGSSLTDLARDVLRAEILRRGLAIIVAETPQPLPPPPRLPIIRVYRDLPDALIAQSVLDSAGIDCFLFDENIIRLNWFRSYVVRGVKLRVGDQDAADAAQLLDQPRLEKFDVEGIGQYIEPCCPNCQSADVSFRPLVKRVAYGLLFLDPTVTIPLKYSAWRCHSCRHEWRTGELGEQLPLNWFLVRSLWILGLALDLASRIDRYGPLSTWFWIAYATISAVCVSRYATHRKFTHAFLVGLVVDTWGVFSMQLYCIPSNNLSPDPFTIYILFSNAFMAGVLGGIALMVFTWFATFFVPEHRRPEAERSI